MGAGTAIRSIQRHHHRHLRHRSGVDFDLGFDLDEFLMMFCDQLRKRAVAAGKATHGRHCCRGIAHRRSSERERLELVDGKDVVAARPHASSSSGSTADGWSGSPARVRTRSGLPLTPDRARSLPGAPMAPCGSSRSRSSHGCAEDRTHAPDSVEIGFRIIIPGSLADDLDPEHLVSGCSLYAM